MDVERTREGHQTGVARVTTAQRRIKALELRTAGGTYRQIGAVLGCSYQTVRRDILRSLQQLAQDEIEVAAHLRQLESQRLDAALRAIWPQVAKGDPVHIRLLLGLVERRCRLLGLDVQPGISAGEGPQGINITIITPDGQAQPLRVVAESKPVVAGEDDCELALLPETADTGGTGGNGGVG